MTDLSIEKLRELYAEWSKDPDTFEQQKQRLRTLAAVAPELIAMAEKWLDPEHDCDWHAHYKAALPPVNEKRKELTEKIGALEFDLAEARAGYHELDKNWNYLHDMSIGMFRSALDMPEATIPEMCARIQANRLGRAPDPNAEIESLKTQIREAREHLIAALDGDSANSKLPLIELIEMLELDLECEWERAEAAEKASGHE